MLQLNRSIPGGRGADAVAPVPMPVPSPLPLPSSAPFPLPIPFPIPVPSPPLSPRRTRGHDSGIGCGAKHKRVGSSRFISNVISKPIVAVGIVWATDAGALFIAFTRATNGVAGPWLSPVPSPLPLQCPQVAKVSHGDLRHPSLTALPVRQPSMVESGSLHRHSHCACRQSDCLSASGNG